MKTLGIPFIVLGLALALAPATAQDGGQTSFTLSTTQDGGQFVFVGEDGTTNPTLVVPASTEITVTLRKGDDAAGIPHNIKVGDQDASDDVANEGDEVTYTFTSPASGTTSYVCVYHATTMVGDVQVAGSDGNGGGNGEDGGNGTPGVQLVGVAIAAVGAALLLRRK